MNPNSLFENKTPRRPTSIQMGAIKAHANLASLNSLVSANSFYSSTCQALFKEIIPMSLLTYQQAQRMIVHMNRTLNELTAGEIDLTISYAMETD